MNRINLQKEELELIVEFANKYPECSYITISSNDSSGIGSIIDVSVATVINGDDVIVTKTIANESNW